LLQWVRTVRSHLVSVLRAASQQTQTSQQTRVVVVDRTETNLTLSKIKWLPQVGSKRQWVVVVRWCPLCVCSIGVWASRFERPCSNLFPSPRGARVMDSKVETVVGGVGWYGVDSASQAIALLMPTCAKHGPLLVLHSSVTLRPTPLTRLWPSPILCSLSCDDVVAATVRIVMVRYPSCSSCSHAPCMRTVLTLPSTGGTHHHSRARISLLSHTPPPLALSLSRIPFSLSVHVHVRMCVHACVCVHARVWCAALQPSPPFLTIPLLMQSHPIPPPLRLSPLGFRSAVTAKASGTPRTCSADGLMLLCLKRALPRPRLAVLH
jgi:hypothetical protein